MSMSIEKALIKLDKIKRKELLRKTELEILDKIDNAIFSIYGLSTKVNYGNRELSHVYPCQLAQTIAVKHYLIPCSLVCQVIGHVKRSTVHNNAKSIYGQIERCSKVKQDYDRILSYLVNN